MDKEPVAQAQDASVTATFQVHDQDGNFKREVTLTSVVTPEQQAALEKASQED